MTNAHTHTHTHTARSHFPAHFLPLAQRDDVYLHLVLEFVPETVYRACRNYTKMKQSMPIIYVQVCGPRAWYR